MKNLNSLFKAQVIFLLAIFLLVSAGCVQSGDKNPGIDESIAKYRMGELVVRADPRSTVNVEQLRHEFWFGCAIPNSLAGGMREDDLKQFKEKFLENFNSAVTENALKWQMMERNRGEVNYDVVDSILNWCEENNIALRGHNLFWGKRQYIQPWVMEMNDEELKQALQQRAESITSRYKGRFAEIDMTNETLDENYFEERLGPGITKLMAEWALNGDPDVKLIMNEHDILISETPAGNRLAASMALFRSVVEQGIPIAGIGIQGHSHFKTFDRRALKRGLDSLATFNLPLRITELNIPGRDYPPVSDRRFQLTPAEEDLVARELTDYLRICFAHPAVEGIILWGFWEGANWIPSSSLYRRDWTLTPSGEAYLNLVCKEWWTNVSGIADRRGEFSTKAFYGKYRVTVDGVSKETDLKKDKGQVTVDFR